MAKKKSDTYVLSDAFIQAARYYSPAIIREAVLKYQAYALYQDETPSTSQEVNMLLGLYKDFIDNARQRYMNCKKNGAKGKSSGIKGGRPKTPKKPQDKPQDEPLYEDVVEDVYDNVDAFVEVGGNEKENENRVDYDNADAYAVDNSFGDDSGYVDSYDNEEPDYDDEVEIPDDDWDDYDEDYLEEDDKPMPTNGSNGLRHYQETSKPNTNSIVSQGGEPLQVKDNPTSFDKVPNPNLTTNKKEIERVYEENLKILQYYDTNNLDFDQKSREALRLATSALMSMTNVTFEQAKKYLSIIRETHRKNNGK